MENLWIKSVLKTAASFFEISAMGDNARPLVSVASHLGWEISVFDKHEAAFHAGKFSHNVCIHEVNSGELPSTLIVR